MAEILQKSGATAGRKGYLIAGDVVGPLPPGASFDGERVFSWLPPPEFAGTFELAFMRRACGGREATIPLRVTIAAKP